MSISFAHLRRLTVAATLLGLAAASAACTRTVYVTEVAPQPAPPPPATVVVDADADASADGTVVADFEEPLGYYGVWLYVAPYGRSPPGS